jgi:NhaA family Na+:H+ antiporter
VHGQEPRGVEKKWSFRAFAQARELFLSGENLSGKLLLTATVIALMWANSPWASSYAALWNMEIGIVLGERFAYSRSLAHWINDGLMFLFFLVIGLEIKREMLVGELRSVKKTLLPLFGAAGGMMAPALIYLFFNHGGAVTGWGIPVATDIAFAVGALMVLGSRVPAGLKIFLLALAIFDDMGAILVIALFYSSELSFQALLIAALILGALICINRRGIRRLPLYMILGFFLWTAFMASGIHPTIAGVILAFTIPAKPTYTVRNFVEESRQIWSQFPQEEFEIMSVNDDQRRAVKDMRAAAANLQSPLRRLEDILQPWSSLVILPVFALANAGVNVVSGGYGFNLAHPVTLGVALGLIIGKPIGITMLSFVACKLGLANLPAGTNFKALLCLGCLGGIGFTMSLFVTGLAFTEAILTHQAKLGILLGSISAAVLGVAALSLYYRHPAAVQAETESGT